MSVPIRATAGAAFRRTLPDVMRMRVVYDEKMRRQDCASWWEAHTSLLRRLLAAQPAPGYKGHKFHLAILALAEDMVRYYKDELYLPEHLKIQENHISRALSDFGPEGHSFTFHYKDTLVFIYGWFPDLSNTSTVKASEYENEWQRYLRQIEALAQQEAELPPVVEGTPALLSPEILETDMSKQQMARLKRALVPWADSYHDMPLQEMPKEVQDLFAAIAGAHGGDMDQAYKAWHEACDIAGKPTSELTYRMR